MKRNKMTLVVRKEFKKINGISRSIAGSFGTEDIHCFRVEVKKLRGFFRLISAGLEGSGCLKIPQYLKKLYDISGSIRSLQLQRQNIEEVIMEIGCASPESYLHVLRMQESSLKIRAKRLMINKRHFRKEKHSILLALPGNLKKSSVKRFLQVSAAKLGELQKPGVFSDESLHMIRKLLKDILYNWKYIKKNAALNYDSSFPDIGNIVMATDLLGKFQDICVGINLLGPPYVGEVKNKDEQALLVKIKQQWLKEKKTAEAQFHSLTIFS